jgi:uncharacterized protein (TIGR03437 family)
LNRFRFFVAAPVLAAIFLAAPAFAQTPANISVISGNGQLACPSCTVGGFETNFEPLQVKVTDANGNPVANTTVNWTVVLGQGTFQNQTSTVQSFTDSNGNASQYFFPPDINFGTQSNPYNPITVAASIANNPTPATFNLTQVLVSATIPALVQVQYLTPATNPPCNTCLNFGGSLSGNAGSTSSVQFKVQVYAPETGAGVPNVSLRLVANQTSPTVSCATGAGADPGSVLTDQNGDATCTVILGTTTGSGSFSAYVGGVVSSAFLATGGPVGVQPNGTFSLTVLPGVPGMISIASGNNQGGNPGQPLSSALVATVADSSGNPLSSQPVVWTVSPAGAATLSSTSGSSSANGQVQNNVTLASSASGAIQIKVALANNPNISATFTVTANVLVSGLQISSGNSQSAVVNTVFALPLVVQLTTNNGSSAANLPVSFTITGPGTLSASSAVTNSAGQAQVNVTAGSTTGAVTVTATAQSFSAAFNLTVIPKGPTLTSGSFFNGADFQQGSISPCSIATIEAPGLAPAIQGAVGFDGIGGLPYQLAGDTITVGGAMAPIYNVANIGGQQQVTFQVPCSVTPGTNAVTVNVSSSTGTVNVTVLPASPGLFTTQLTSTTSVPVLERPDGSFVGPGNPGRQGETLIAYVTGLGPTTPAVATNSLPVPGSNATVQGTVTVGIAFNGSASGESPISASLAQDTVGVYLVAFQVPSGLPSGTTNVGFSVSVLPQGSSTVYYSTLGTFPVQ